MDLLQAADDERASQGKAKKQQSDKDAMSHLDLANSFLGLFRKENDIVKPRQTGGQQTPLGPPHPFLEKGLISACCL